MNYGSTRQGASIGEQARTGNPCPKKSKVIDEIVARQEIAAALALGAGPCPKEAHTFKPESLRCACGKDYRASIPSAGP